MTTPNVTFGPSPSGHEWWANGYVDRPEEFGGRCITVQCAGCKELGIVWRSHPSEIRRLDKSKSLFRWFDHRRVFVVTSGPALEFTHERRNPPE